MLTNVKSYTKAISVRRRVIGVLGVLLTAGCLLPSCGIRYVAVSGYYEAELLASAQPVATVRASGGLSAGEEQRLNLVPEIKAFGAAVGLAKNHNYETVALNWKRTIWNVSASDPLHFEPVSWWFPIVGKIHYLGFFRDAEASSWRVKMEGEGYDVYVREAGAFSTLGWFRDPILPAMLRWDESQLAGTILHELAHATLWIPGSAMFNETFAEVVGSEAEDQYLRKKYGAENAYVADVSIGNEDWRTFRQLLESLYADLDALYKNPSLDDGAKRAEKETLYKTLDTRVLASNINRKARYLQIVRTTAWNNARLIQYRTYDEHQEWFAALMDRDNHNISAFIEDIRRITRGGNDPYAALAAALGVKNP